MEGAPGEGIYRAMAQEFLAALRRREHYDALLELVHRYEAHGTPPREAYDVLQRIWLDFGFNKIDEDSGLQDDLEYVMEKIWYECPAPGK